jgi:putative N-acetylmannosamine-6-phosphate epimerase
MGLGHHNWGMTVETLLNRLRQCPLIASVQASEKSPVDHPETLARLARASVQQGVRLLRLEGIKPVRVIKPEAKIPVIGLLKRKYPGSHVYITPTIQDAESMADLGCEIVAFDATSRARPHGQEVGAIIDRMKSRKVLTMADCDSVEAAVEAERMGADLVGTTLAGYTSARGLTDGPDLELLREIVNAVKIPVLAEGRYANRWEVEAALRIGAKGVVVGGALNDPVKQTKALMPTPRPGGKVGAVDLGGTWMRFAVFGEDWNLELVEREPLAATGAARVAWVRDRIAHHQVVRVGVSTAGIIDPATGEVWTAKEYLMPDHVGTVWTSKTLGVPVVAHGDGHVTAWGHACLPQFAGKRVATLAIGTGVGCGFIQEGRIWSGKRGEYPRINDLPTAEGSTYEELLGGVSISSAPSQEQQARGVKALEGAVKALQDLYFPDAIVIAGGVGTSPWLAPHVARVGAELTPFGHDAGLHGAAALALFLPAGVPII